MKTILEWLTDTFIAFLLLNMKKYIFVGGDISTPNNHVLNMDMIRLYFKA